MDRGYVLWLAALGIASSVLLVPASHQVFVALTKAHPYIMGFIKFMVLATMGELLAIRISAGIWKNPPGLFYRAVLWGLFGAVIVLMFEVFAGGIGAAIAKNLLWVGESDSFLARLLTAFWIASLMNLTFGPAFMTAHRITDTYIDLICGEGIPPGKVKISDVVARINWQNIVSFVVLKTIPYFWIPAHTITFLLPPEYRILVAAYLSIALGAILSFAKRKTMQPKVVEE